MRQLNITGEILSADDSAVDSFVDKLDNIILKNHLGPQQIYNCDETALNFKTLPTKTLAMQQEQSAPGCKRSKERVTFLACANESVITSLNSC